MLRLAVILPAATLIAALAPQSQADTTTVIRLISTFDEARIVDHEPKGLAGRGDVVVSSDRLTNAVAQFGRPKGAVVGHDRGRFTLLTATRMHLDGWTSLPSGRIHVRGLVRSTGRGRVSMPVVGGTDDFASARGIVTVAPHPTPARTLVIYRLKLP